MGHGKARDGRRDAVADGEVPGKRGARRQGHGGARRRVRPREPRREGKAQRPRQGNPPEPRPWARDKEGRDVHTQTGIIKTSEVYRQT